jgi:hypothetical protein
MTFQLLRLKPVALPLPPSDGFTPSVNQAKALITPRTRAIALVTPNNPCGTIYPPSLIASFYQLAKRSEIALIVDETYRDFVPPSVQGPGSGSGGRGKPHDLFDEPDWDETLVSLFSFSKSYKIPGYRLGGIVASRTVLEACRTVADCIQASLRGRSRFYERGQTDRILIFCILLASTDLPSQTPSTRPSRTLTRSQTFIGLHIKSLDVPPRTVRSRHLYRPRLVRRLLWRVLFLCKVSRLVRVRCQLGTGGREVGQGMRGVDASWELVHAREGGRRVEEPREDGK